MKKQLLLYAIALLVSGPGATAAVEYEGYTNPAGDKFPIAVYDNVSINATKNGQPLTDAEQKAYFDDINKMEKTSAWNAAKSVNNEVAQYGKYLMEATYDRSCLVTNDTVHLYDGFDRASKSFYDILVTKHSGNALLLSHLTAGDSEYVAIVNQDHLKSQKITLAFNTKKNYFRVAITYPVVLPPVVPTNTNDTDDSVIIRQESFVLQPGAMILFKKTI